MTRLRIMKMTKPRVGLWATGAGCYGCLLSFIFNEDDIVDLLKVVDLVALPFIKGKNEEDFDVLFIEGTPCSKEDVEVTKKLAAKAKIVVALGACSSTGGIPAYRNFVPEKNYEYLKHKKNDNISDVKPEPIEAHVKVDYQVRGCPPDKEELKNFIKDLVLGKKPKEYKRPVCEECRLKENSCLLEKGRICLGPVTRGNCNAICPSSGFECWGCRGPTDDANFGELKALLKEKGITDEQINLRLNTFAGKLFQEEIKKNG